MRVELKHITGPQAAFGHMKDIHGVKDYLDLQEAYMNRQRATIRGLGEPFLSASKVESYVNESRLLVDCACGNGVIVDAVNEIACCLWCGAIYRNEMITMPSPSSLERLDRALGKKHTRERNWDRRHKIVLTDPRRSV